MTTPVIISTAAHGVRATITYVMKPSPYSGPADSEPFIGSGILHVQSRGGSFSLPLSALAIDTNHKSIFLQSPSQGCGTGAALTIHQSPDKRDYLIVETIGIGKGCYAAAHVVDVATHKVIQEYAVDHASDHVNDVPPSTFLSQGTLTVNGIERFAIPVGAPNAAWTLTMIQGSGAAIFAENLPALETPRVGETLTLGIIHDQTFTAPLFVDGRIFRLSPAHELAWAARQTPVPASIHRTQMYNMYFGYSQRLAWDGHFAEALSVYRHALPYLDDAGLRQGEAADIPRLAAIVQAVRENCMTIAKAKEEWFKP